MLATSSTRLVSVAELFIRGRAAQQLMLHLLWQTSGQFSKHCIECALVKLSRVCILPAAGASWVEVHPQRQCAAQGPETEQSAGECQL